MIFDIEGGFDEKDNEVIGMGGIMGSFVSLIGCNSYSSEEQKKEYAQSFLKEKYNEEFVVYDTWGGDGYTYTALSSPTSDTSIKFEGEFPSDGSGDFRDEYVQGIISKKLEAVVLPEIQKISEGCFVKPLVFYKDTVFTNKKDISIDNYVKSVDEVKVLFVIVIDKSKLKNIGYEKEYDIFSELYTKLKPIKATANLYYVNNDIFESCKSYFEEHADLYSAFDEIVEPNKDIGFGYTSEKINITQDKFSKFRNEVK